MAKLFLMFGLFLCFKECLLAKLAPTYSALIKKMDSYILPPLWYDFGALEPYIDENTMHVHFWGHLDGYKKKMNEVFKKWKEHEPDNPLAFESILHIIMNLDKVPQAYMEDLRFFGGGFVNHCFYFGILSPNEDEVDRAPTGYLLDDINANFGSLDGLKKKIEEAMKEIRGSGYIWVNRLPGKEGKDSLRVTTTANQDSPIMAGLHPIIVVDMWEHAYYLKHNYKKWDHLKDFWMVLDWDYVERLDQWWKNLDEEQRKADERVEALKRSLDEREERAKQKEDNGKEKKEKSEL